MLAKGQGTKPDVIEAERLLKSLGDDDDAQYKLAEIFLFYDVAIPDHYEKAKQLFELLHERGRRRYIRHMSAYYLGLLNYQGWGVQRDYKSAFDYFLEAAKFGGRKHKSSSQFFIQRDLERCKVTKMHTCGLRLRRLTGIQMQPQSRCSTKAVIANRIGRGTI